MQEQATRERAGGSISYGYRIGGARMGASPLEGAANGDAERGLALFRVGRHDEAMPFVVRAAEAGDRRAQYVLATALFNGDHVTRDLPAAFAMMRRARDAGLPQAANSLAAMTQLEPVVAGGDGAGGDGMVSDEAVRLCRTLLATLRPATVVPPVPGDTFRDLVGGMLRAELREPLERLLPAAFERSLATFVDQARAAGS